MPVINSRVCYLVIIEITIGWDLDQYFFIRNCPEKFFFTDIVAWSKIPHDISISVIHRYYLSNGSQTWQSVNLTNSPHKVTQTCSHDDVFKRKHFPRYWPFVRGIHRSPVNSPHKGWWRRSLMFSLILAWTNSWVNNRDAGDLRRHCGPHDVPGDLRRHRAHYDVIAMDLP